MPTRTPQVPDEIACLYERYRVALVARCTGILGDRDAAEDVVQETFIRALAKFEDVDRSRSLWPWLATIAQRLAIDALRSQRARRLSGTPEPTDDGATAADRTFDVVHRNAVMAELRRAVSELPPRQQRMLLLHAEGRGYDEIASLERTTVSSVKSGLFRARTRLRRTFGGLGEVLGTLTWCVLAGRWSRARARARARLDQASFVSLAGAVQAVATLAIVAAVVGAPDQGRFPRAIDRSAAAMPTDVAQRPPHALHADRAAEPTERMARSRTGRVTSIAGPATVETRGGVSTGGSPQGSAEITETDDAGRTRAFLGLTIYCDHGTVTRSACSVLAVYDEHASTP